MDELRLNRYTENINYIVESIGIDDTIILDSLKEIPNIKSV